MGKKYRGYLNPKLPNSVGNINVNNPFRESKYD